MLCLALVAIASAVGAEFTFQGASLGTGMLYLALLLPMGMYWWVAQSGPLLHALFKRAFGKFLSQT
jgi:hypothetical protein